jgi:hypothetical protein
MRRQEEGIFTTEGAEGAEEEGELYPQISVDGRRFWKGKEGSHKAPNEEGGVGVAGERADWELRSFRIKSTRITKPVTARFGWSCMAAGHPAKRC